MPEYLAPYTSVEKCGRFGHVRTEAADAVLPVLLVGGAGIAEERGGRGGIVRFPLHPGEGVLRRYRRGGLAARILGDRYFRNRMWREFDLMARLHWSGMAVPKPLGVTWHRRAGFYRGALATEAIDGITLLDYLREGRPDRDLLLQCGRTIRAFHDAGVWHADLQVKNILVRGGEVWLIDFDNGRDGRPLSTMDRARNLLRLRRSLEKHGQSLDNFQTIWEGYGKLGLPRWLTVVYRVRGMVSDALRK